MPEPLRLVIADDHAILRDGLRRLLESEPGVTVVGVASDGEEAVELAGRLRPDLLLLDLSMPRVPGMEALERLAAQQIPVKVLVLTAAASRAEVLQALRLGALGVVLKDSATEVLLKAIRTVMAGQYWVGREIVGSLVELTRQLARPAGGGSAPALTPREQDIVSAVAAGCSNRDIARQLGISEYTVKHHLTSIFDKMGVSSRLELALMARAQGLGG